MGIIIVIGVIIISMASAMYMYVQYQTNFIMADAGNPVIVGPIEYAVTFDGTHKGNKETVAENTFVKIRVIAKNISDENIKISGEQFYIIDEKQQKHQSTYGGFSKEDLSNDWLEPNKPTMFTTQFDIPYDESKQYNIAIRPLKQHSSIDTALICITNC